MTCGTNKADRKRRFDRTLTELHPPRGAPRVWPRVLLLLVPVQGLGPVFQVQGSGFRAVRREREGVCVRERERERAREREGEGEREIQREREAKRSAFVSAFLLCGALHLRVGQAGRESESERGERQQVTRPSSEREREREG